MDKTTLFILILWSIQALRQTLIWAYWLQAKEYRLDRFRVLLDSKEGLKNLEIKTIIFKFAALFAALFYGLNLPAILLFIWLNIKFANEIVTRTVRKPVLTLRIAEILGTSFAGIALTLWLNNQSGIITSRLALGEVLLLALPFVGIAWTTPLVERSKKEVIQKATARLNRIKPVVVGITGSYGKSTTKELIAHILSHKYKVEKTEKNLNTDWGVARKATSLALDTEVFVVEMGAYKKGETKSIAEVVKPRIGIITGIEPQHLSLFGSMENIKSAKYELIKSLPQDGIAIFNVTNPACRELAERAKSEGRKVYTYAVDSKEEADLTAKIRKEKTESVTFKLKIDKKEMEITAPIKGKHFVENILAGILVARELKIDWKQIREAVKNIDKVGKTLSVYKKGAATVIDDSYNATPAAFSSALDYLSLYKEKTKILITSGIIELGERSDEIHREVGRHAGKIADEIVLTNSDFEKSFKEGLGENTNKLRIVKGEELVEMLKYYLLQDCAILVEGRLPARVANLLKEEK